MGKRKSSRKVEKKARTKLDKEFDCLFCNHEKSIAITLDREHQVGKLECRKCGVSYQTPIHFLSEAIDVYSDWVDAAEELNKQQAAATASAAAQQSKQRSNSAGGGGGRSRNSDPEDVDVDDEDEDEGDYGRNTGGGSSRAAQQFEDEEEDNDDDDDLEF